MSSMRQNKYRITCLEILWNNVHQKTFQWMECIKQWVSWCIVIATEFFSLLVVQCESKMCSEQCAHCIAFQFHIKNECCFNAYFIMQFNNSGCIFRRVSDFKTSAFHVYSFYWAHEIACHPFVRCWWRFFFVVERWNCKFSFGLM